MTTPTPKRRNTQITSNKTDSRHRTLAPAKSLSAPDEFDFRIFGVAGAGLNEVKEAPVFRSYLAPTLGHPVTGLTIVSEHTCH